MRQLIARGAERCRGGKGCGNDCNWGLECVGSWSEIGDSWVLEVREREHPPCVGNQHQRGYGGDRTPARERSGERKGERNCGEEVALMDARWEDEEGDRDQREGGDRSGALVVSCRPRCHGDRHKEQECSDKECRWAEAKERSGVAPPASVQDDACPTAIRERPEIPRVHAQVWVGSRRLANSLDHVNHG